MVQKMFFLTRKETKPESKGCTRRGAAVGVFVPAAGVRAERRPRRVPAAIRRSLRCTYRPAEVIILIL